MKKNLTFVEHKLQQKRIEKSKSTADYIRFYDLQVFLYFAQLFLYFCSGLSLALRFSFNNSFIFFFLIRSLIIVARQYNIVQQEKLLTEL